MTTMPAIAGCCCTGNCNCCVKGEDATCYSSSYGADVVVFVVGGDVAVVPNVSAVAVDNSSNESSVLSQVVTHHLRNICLLEL